jgi:hypothetical protein
MVARAASEPGDLAGSTMGEQTYSLEFAGYWPDWRKDLLPAQPGLYCVYECTHNPANNTVSFHQLIHVGEAEDVRARISGHEKYEDWKRHVLPDKALFYSVAAVDDVDRARCEAALIFAHQLPENTAFRTSFPFERTTIKLSGKIDLLNPAFAVNRS